MPERDLVFGGAQTTIYEKDDHITNATNWAKRCGCS